LTDVVYYRPPQSLNEKEVFYLGSVNEQESLLTWSREKCVPLVREITFANAEELTDEGLPFLILFHKADDHESITLFEREVAKQLLNERCKYEFNFNEKISFFFF
jgi:endoplasmic reticulum resident protein 44